MRHPTYAQYLPVADHEVDVIPEDVWSVPGRCRVTNVAEGPNKVVKCRTIDARAAP